VHAKCSLRVGSLLTAHATIKPCWRPAATSMLHFHLQAVRASQGAVFRLPLATCSLDQLQAAAQHHRLVMVAAEPEPEAGGAGQQPPGGQPQPQPQGVVLVLGSEGAGLSPAVLKVGCQGMQLPFSQACKDTVKTGQACGWSLDTVCLTYRLVSAPGVVMYAHAELHPCVHPYGWQHGVPECCCGWLHPHVCSEPRRAAGSASATQQSRPGAKACKCIATAAQSACSLKVVPVEEPC
jgi:hypothetical protein